MYLRHFGLERDPFEPPSASRPPGLPGGHRSACREIVRSIREHRGLTALIGAAGVGKSTVVEAACRELPESIDVVILKVGRPDAEAFYRSVFDELGIWEQASSPEGALRRLQMHLVEASGRGIHTVLVLDHAHDLGTEVLREVGKLASLEPWLQLLLVGHPELVDKLLDEALGDLHEQFAAACVLEPLTEEQLAGLLRNRIVDCGGSPRLFDSDAMTELRRLSRGLPGRAFRIADDALRLAYGRGLDRVGGDSVRRVGEAGAGSGTLGPGTVSRFSGVDRDGAARSVRRIGGRPRRRATSSSRAGKELAVAAAGGGPAEAGNRQMPVPEAVPVFAAGAAGSRESSDEGGSEPWWATTPPGSAQRSSRPPSRERRPSRIAGPADEAERGSGARQTGDRRSRPGQAEPDPVPRELLAVLEDPHGIASEQFRVLRLKLEGWIDRGGGEPRSLLVTSSGPGEGKTMVTSNLALLMAVARPGRVLLVDGDLRRPRINGLFDLPRRPGLADLLADRAELDEAIHYLSRHSLAIVPSGRPGNPRDLMSADRIAPVLARMTGRFDVVLIDGTPLQPMVDARSLAGSVDGVLVAVRAGRTRYPNLQEALRSIERDRLLGVVMNEVEEELVNAYGGYRT